MTPAPVTATRVVSTAAPATVIDHTRVVTVTRDITGRTTTVTEQVAPPTAQPTTTPRPAAGNWPTPLFPLSTRLAWPPRC